jgi:hypothetical protein
MVSVLHTIDCLVRGRRSGRPPTTCPAVERFSEFYPGSAIRHYAETPPMLMVDLDCMHQMVLQLTFDTATMRTHGSLPT